MPAFLEIAGFFAIAAGVGYINRPAGIIAAGVFAIIVGVLLDGVTFSRRKKNPDQ